MNVLLEFPLLFPSSRRCCLCKATGGGAFKPVIGVPASLLSPSRRVQSPPPPAHPYPAAAANQAVQKGGSKKVQQGQVQLGQAQAAKSMKSIGVERGEKAGRLKKADGGKSCTLLDLQGGGDVRGGRSEVGGTAVAAQAGLVVRIKRPVGPSSSPFSPTRQGESATGAGHGADRGAGASVRSVLSDGEVEVSSVALRGMEAGRDRGRDRGREAEGSALQSPTSVAQEGTEGAVALSPDTVDARVSSTVPGRNKGTVGDGCANKASVGAFAGDARRGGSREANGGAPPPVAPSVSALPEGGAGRGRRLRDVWSDDSSSMDADRATEGTVGTDVVTTAAVPAVTSAHGRAAHMPSPMASPLMSPTCQAGMQVSGAELQCEDQGLGFMSGEETSTASLPPWGEGSAAGACQAGRRARGRKGLGTGRGKPSSKKNALSGGEGSVQVSGESGRAYASGEGNGGYRNQLVSGGSGELLLVDNSLSGKQRTGGGKTRRSNEKEGNRKKRGASVGRDGDGGGVEGEREKVGREEGVFEWSGSLWVHVACALFDPDVFFGDLEAQQPIM